MSEQERLRGYLLGTLPAADGEALEQQLLVDEELNERLDLAQDALVEAHLRGTLPAADRSAFDARAAANPELAAALRHARLLYERLGPRAAGSSLRPFWLAAAALALLGGASWWWLARVPAVPRSAAVPSAAPTVIPSAAPTAGPGTVSPAPPVDMAALTLSPGQVMAGSATERVVLGPSVRRLRIELVVDGPVAPAYAGELWNESERSVWRAEGLRSSAEGVVAVTLPADLLRPGRYRLDLSLLLRTGGRGAPTPYFFEIGR